VLPKKKKKIGLKGHPTYEAGPFISSGPTKKRRAVVEKVKQLLADNAISEK
jgi:hypothetical protein